MISSSHNIFAGYNTTFYHDIVTELRSQLYETTFNRRVTTHNENMCSTFLDHQSLLRYNGSMLAYIKQYTYFSELTRKQYTIRIGHLSTNRECTRLGIDLRFSKIYNTFIYIGAVIRQGNGNSRLPGAARIFLTYDNITFFTFQIIQCCHTKIHQYGVTLYNRSQQGLSTSTYQCTKVHMTFTDVARYRRTYPRIAQFLFRLIEISLAHTHAGYSRFISRNSIIQIQLTGCILFKQRTDTLQITLGFTHQSRILTQLSTSLICFGTILLLVDDEQDLIFRHIRTFLKSHTL